MKRLLALAPGLLAAAAALAVVPLSGCSDCPASCAAPDMVLDLCDAAKADLVSSEASGACRIEGLYVTFLAQEGDCHVVLHYRDGTRSEIHAWVGWRSDSCCQGYYPDVDHRYFTVPHPDCQQPWMPRDAGYESPDAASCPYPQSGCYTHSEFENCACRCKDWEVPTAGVGTYPASGCSVGCGCGFGEDEADYGCAKDEDCVLVRAGCCPCTSGGASMAVIKSKQLAWEDQMVAHCPPSGQGSFGCPEVDVCAGRRAVCANGHCRALAP